MNDTLATAIVDLERIMKTCSAQVTQPDNMCTTLFWARCEGAIEAGNAAKCDMEAVLEEGVEGDFEEEVKAVQSQAESLQKFYRAMHASQEAVGMAP